MARINLPAAIGLGLIWLVVGIHMTGARYRGEPFWSEPLKRALYLRDVGLEAPAAKEVRLFGLADWLVGRYTAAWQEVVLGLWAARRVDFRRTTALAVVLMAATAAVLLWAVQSTLAGQLALGQLAVLIQAALAMAGSAAWTGTCGSRTAPCQSRRSWRSNVSWPCNPDLARRRLPAPRHRASASSA